MLLQGILHVSEMKNKIYKILKNNPLHAKLQQSNKVNEKKL